MYIMRFIRKYFRTGSSIPGRNKYKRARCAVPLQCNQPFNQCEYKGNIILSPLERVYDIPLPQGIFSAGRRDYHRGLQYPHQTSCL